MPNREQTQARQWLVAALLLILLVPEFVRQVASAWDWGYDSWQMGDWLIRYEAGFVRRGLAGSLFGFLADVTGSPANGWAIGVSLIAFLVLGCWLLIKGRSCFSSALVASAVVLGFPVLQDSLIRKDCLLLLILAACVEIENSKRTGRGRTWWVNLLACVGVLLHEAFLFFGLPALLLIGVDDRRALCFRILQRLPMVGCGVLTILFHGSPDQARLIHESWLPLWEEIEGKGVPEEPAGAIAALGWSASEGMALVRPIWASAYQPLAWLMVATTSGLIALGFTNGKSRVPVLGWLAIQALAVVPLFVVGIDYGRWIFLWVTSSLVLVAGGAALPGGLARCLDVLVGGSKVRLWWDRVSSHEWVLLGFGVPVLWSIELFLHAGPLPRLVARFLEK